MDLTELIPVTRQSTRRWHSHEPNGRLSLLSARPAVTFPAREHASPPFHQFILFGDRGRCANHSHEIRKRDEWKVWPPVGVTKDRLGCLCALPPPCPIVYLRIVMDSTLRGFGGGPTGGGPTWDIRPPPRSPEWRSQVGSRGGVWRTKSPKDVKTVQKLLYTE